MKANDPKVKQLSVLHDSDRNLLIRVGSRDPFFLPRIATIIVDEYRIKNITLDADTLTREVREELRK